MKKNMYIIVGVSILAIAICAAVVITILNGLKGIGNPTGGKGPDYPYFIATEPIVVKKITVPKGSKLTYEEQFWKKGKQDKIMREDKLMDIQFPEGQTIDWGGVPVFMFVKFFNEDMKGFAAYADFNKLAEGKNTKFSELWKSADNELGLLVKNTDDWTFNVENIVDIASCGVNNQRFFKENKEQQQFLDSLYMELIKVK